MTNAAYTAAYQLELKAFIDSNALKLQNDKMTSEERMRLEQKVSNAIAQQHQLAGQNINTAWAEANYRMNTTTYDYAGRIVQAWQEMGSEISDHLMAMIQGTESFGDGIKGIFQDICKSVLKMWIDMVTQMYIMNPLKQFLGGMMGGIGGGGSSDGYTTGGLGSFIEGVLVPGHAAGGIASGWSIVGEQGPELVNFSNPGRVYNNSDTQGLMAGNSGNVHLHFSPQIHVASASKADTNNMLSQTADQWRQFRTQFINDLRNNTSLRSAVRGATA